MITRLSSALRRYRSVLSRRELTLSEWIRLGRLPRYVPTTTHLSHREIQVLDACTFLGGLDEIFGKRIYEFEASTDQPLIIDCGANIGLSVIFFKKLYPASRISAFEPDTTIFNALQHNVSAFGFTDVEVHNKAVWCSKTVVDFHLEGGFSGRIAKPGDDSNLVKVDTVRLRCLLDQPVDFLKIDIEGAETDVIRDCVGMLGNVSKLFIEYHSHSQEPQTLHEILAILCNAGFRYHIKEAYASPHPFTERPLLLGMDLQLNIFAFRV